MHEVELDGITYGPPKPIVWYPGGLAWEIAAPKRVVRKNEEFKKFQKFLVGETDVVSGERAVCRRDVTAHARTRTVDYSS